MTVPMALMDFIPVILFVVSAVILQRGLYDVMSKGAFALFAGGTIMISAAGVFKAIWKLLYALDICDFEQLNHAFFPMQSVGFLLAGIAAIAFAFYPQKEKSAAAFLTAAPFKGTMIFVTATVLGTIGLCTGLAVEAKRRSKPACVVLFILTGILFLCMGYLSSKDFEKAVFNWIAQSVNLAAQAVFLIGSIKLVGKKA